MPLKAPLNFDDTQVKMILDQIPVGITVTDLEGRILFYNAYCSQIVDRKPEYIGQDIRPCHQKSESIVKIDIIFGEIREGQRREYYYESKRGGKRLGVTILPYEVDGQITGFIQTIVVKP